MRKERDGKKSRDEEREREREKVEESRKEGLGDENKVMPAKVVMISGQHGDERGAYKY